MGLFRVSPEKERLLRARMEELGVSEQDLKETFIHAPGPGGQHVNKVATGVYLVHLPTGLAVKCHQTRSQALNRFLARRILLDGIERARQGGKGERNETVGSKIRRQKSRRARRVRNKKGEKVDVRSPSLNENTKNELSGADHLE